MTELLIGLNERQKEAILYKDGPLLIIAGAGSGKTRVLTRRIAYLIAGGVSPYEILAITFTNKAASEMKERIRELTSGFTSKALWVSTFHSMCNRILRQEIEVLGYTIHFNIYDSSDQEALIKKVIKKNKIDEKKFTPKSFLYAISDCKNRMEDYLIAQKKGSDFFKDTIGQVYESYQKALKEANSLDFDDLLYLTVKLFKKYPDILGKYQERFKYISVDEYQDTSYVQFLLVKMLAGKYNNICAVGDPDQSIYGWRGANMNNILDFEKYHINTKTIYLEQNYRSSEIILAAANSVIKNNSDRKPKSLWTENKGGKLICCYEAADESEEAIFVVREIEKISRKEKRPYSDFAVFYRTNAQSRIIEKSLARYGIPYKLYGGVSFFKRKEIKDIISFLQYLNNPADPIGFERIVNTPKRGIGKATVEKIFAFTRDQEITLEDSLNRLDEYLSDTIAAKVKCFIDLIKILRELVGNVSLTELTEAIFKKTGYLKSLEVEKTEEAKDRILNVQELLSETREFDLYDEEKTLEAFLSNIALYSETDELNNDEKITLITLHMAKGLEYKIIFIIGMEEGIFPHYRVQEDSFEMEEERRLCYVGITRGKEKVYLTRAWQRNQFGITRGNDKSRFLGEIPEELLEFPHRVTIKKRDNFIRDLLKKDKDGSGFALGDRIFHSKFGEGMIVKVGGEVSDDVISIAFPNLGVKKLIVKYAPIKKIK